MKCRSMIGAGGQKTPDRETMESKCSRRGALVGDVVLHRCLQLGREGEFTIQDLTLSTLLRASFGLVGWCEPERRGGRSEGLRRRRLKVAY
jgi:hypothetical protein